MNRMNHYEIISARDAHIHALLTPEENEHLQQYRRRKLCLLWAKQTSLLLFFFAIIAIGMLQFPDSPYLIIPLLLVMGYAIIKIISDHEHTLGPLYEIRRLKNCRFFAGQILAVQENKDGTHNGCRHHFTVALSNTKATSPVYCTKKQHAALHLGERILIVRYDDGSMHVIGRS